MYYANIKENDIADGNGVRVSLFVSGCTHHCKGCFNPETWDFHYGQPFTKETIDKILQLLEKEHIAGLTLLGGEPLEPDNQRALLPLVKEVKDKFPKKDIWCYTGYLLDKDILGFATNSNKRAQCEVTKELVALLDVVVDGEFVLDKKDITLKFRGSSNQRIISVSDTLKAGEIVLAKGI